MYAGQYYDDPDPFGGGFPGPRRGVNQRFDQYYRCYPVAMMATERDNVNHGGKLILPPSALDKLTRLHISYPMLFELRPGKKSADGKERMTHAGVLEFISEEGRVYLPHWMMQTLHLEPGDLLQVLSTDLPRGQFVKLQPQSTAFLAISDPKAVLENALRNYSALSLEDVISFSYNDSVYELAVVEVKPTVKGAIGITETDLETDFAPPVGYVEPTYERKTLAGGSNGSTRPNSGMANVMGFGQMAAEIGYNPPVEGSTSGTGSGSSLLKPSSAFTAGGGQKLSGKKSKSATGTGTMTPVAASAPPISTASSVFKPTSRLINVSDLNTGMSKPAPLRLPFGKIFLGYEVKPVKVKETTATEEEAGDNQTKQVFSGNGQTLRGGDGKGKRKAPAPVEDVKGKAKATTATGTTGSGSRLGKAKAKQDIIEID